jgi:hypothetical protein
MSIRFKAKPFADSGSECGAPNCPPDPDVVHFDVGLDPLLLPSLSEQTWTAKLPLLKLLNSWEIKELTVVAADPEACGSDELATAEEPWMAYSIPLRAADVRFRVTRRK